MEYNILQRNIFHDLLVRMNDIIIYWIPPKETPSAYMLIP